ncbi:MAG: hypothetical protein WBQ79_03865 [Acidobacteriaceae bacterium]
MTSLLWSLVEFAAAPLAREEREAVIGDSLEAGDTFWKALAGVLGLVVRRQFLRWRSWRPWFATFLLALPAGYLLTYVSMSVTCTSERLMGMKVGHWAPTGHEGIWMLLCHIFLLVTWAWTSGFAVSSLSPRTLCVTIALCCVKLLSFEMHFDFGPISPFFSLLFVAPAIWGLRQGKLTGRLSLRTALLLAATMTVLTTAAWIHNSLWDLNWFLLFPVWYLVAAASRPPSEKTDSRLRKLPSQVKTTI